jgi:hypothetical protein
VSVLSQTLSSLPLEVQAGGVKKHKLQLAEQIAVAAEKLLFDEILAAAQSMSIASQLNARLAQPPHGTIQVMEFDGLCAPNLQVLFPPLGGAVAAGLHQSMQNSEEDGPFKGKLLSPLGCQTLDHRIDSQPLPQAFENKGGADGHAAVGLHGAVALGINEGTDGGKLRQ